MKKMICLLSLIFSYSCHCMDVEGVHFDIQNLSSCRKMVIKVVDNPRLQLLKVDKTLEKVKSLEVSYSTEEPTKELELVVSSEPFSGVVKVYEEDGIKELFDILVSKSHKDSSPVIKLSSSKSSTKKCALFYSLGGGGSSYVIALGNKNEEVSEEKVKETQPLGDLMTFTLISPEDE